MEVCKVVTCFLECGGKILILRRGERVSSYQKCWAGISGFMEGDETPHERALKEIEEEVGIRKKDLVLVKQGEPFEVRDEDIGKLWIVHPFLFEVKNEKIRMDTREHMEYKWIKPEDIENYQTVPELKKSLEKLFLHS